MKRTKQAKLKRRGLAVGNAEDPLALTPEEAASLRGEGSARGAPSALARVGASQQIENAEWICHSALSAWWRWGESNPRPRTCQ
jgi:hypothetical protein